MDLSKAQKHQLDLLNEIDEMSQEVIQQMNIIQQQQEKWHDKFIKKKQFKEGDWVILFYSRHKDFKGKFHT